MCLIDCLSASVLITLQFRSPFLNWFGDFFNLLKIYFFFIRTLLVFCYGG